MKSNTKKTILVVIATVLIIFGVLCILGGIVTNAEINKKLDKYESVKAKIIDYNVKSVGGGRRLTTRQHYYPIYSYKVDGKKYEYESKSATTSRPGGTKTIYYDPDKPSRVITAEEKFAGMMYIVVGSVFSFFGVIILIGVAISSKSRNKR